VIYIAKKSIKKFDDGAAVLGYRKYTRLLNGEAVEITQKPDKETLKYIKLKHEVNNNG